ncbi:hypothetical protein COV87_00445 [Candidatus Roizmanbacteria bacterium CG11_big_fil_rev_8_21_14_0_20_37_16]|uniref:DUF6922 domain-containing protein n=2 Tax=Candidatus Roizmaniibacteriota TaxID=1752723 RepID=A0A2H0KL69_9BACT|nr:MAG: hypothetical protein COV87_00445 [Candidatus Roizmanbacteria bacterium CG11_big_fil_rev_8_21_14_0_20_37_16]PIV08594.1 MAG: hypothetical protein COS52_01870 [Candidatus Roizmanbacteria bacterium CG03_land_8_20_14_0_80_39_12]
MTIPTSLHHFFWDVDVSKLDPEKKQYFVISRLLDKGDVEAVKWVRNHYDAEDIRETLENYRDFSLQSGSLWALIYQVSIEKVKCFQEPYRNMRKTLWPY